MNEYDAIRAAFAHNRKDAELLLHEIRARHSGGGNKQQGQTTGKDQPVLRAADTGAAQRKALINMEVEG